MCMKMRCYCETKRHPGSASPRVILHWRVCESFACGKKRRMHYKNQCCVVCPMCLCCEMDDARYSLHIIIHLRRHYLTSPRLLYSPASLHSPSHPWYRCSLPGQVWSRKDRRLCPYNSSTSRACRWRDFGSSYVPYP